jgi:catechol 2,3-dioxygenase-like lactoylglutathione lyase family enzyme
MVNDVDEAVAFYVSKLGFELQQQFGPAIAILTHGDLELLVAGPRTSAAQPMPDGTRPTPGGGWARFVLTVDDLESYVSQLRAQGVEFKNEILENQGRKQILCVDPSNNIIELFEDAPG